MVQQNAIYGSLAAATVVLTALLYSHYTRVESQDDLDFPHLDMNLTDSEEIVKRFAGALRFKTVSSYEAENHAVQPEEFKALHKYLRKQWPLVFKTLRVQEVNQLSLLFKWPGTDVSLKPILCISHLDVVAIGSEEKWTYPPFSGAVADGFVWGRGALDVKVTATALLEGVSHLLRQGYVPQRTLYLAFGHDEEVLGSFGAAAISKLLQESGVSELEYVFDEGGSIISDGIPGMTTTPLALVGTAEKAYQNFEVEVHGKGGHTMLPPQDGMNAASRLARIIDKVDTKLPKPTLRPPTSQMLKSVGQVADSNFLGVLLRNCDVWPISILVTYIMSRSHGDLSACVRTTGVLTDIELLPPGKNVIPSLARAHFNFRLLPGEQADYPEAFLEQLAAGERRGGEVKVVRRDSMELSAISSPDSIGFRTIQQAALEILRGPKGLVVTPYLMMGRTDSSQYSAISNGNVFRIMPFSLNRTAGDLKRIHGIDERIGVEAYLQGVKFFIRYLQLALEK